jgi:hypothetical protein
MTSEASKERATDEELREATIRSVAQAYREGVVTFPEAMRDVWGAALDSLRADRVESDTLVAAKAEHDEYHVVYFEDCVWCRSWAVDSLRERIAASDRKIERERDAATLPFLDQDAAVRILCCDADVARPLVEVVRDALFTARANRDPRNRRRSADTEKRERDEALARIARVEALQSFGAEVELRTPTGSGEIVTRSEIEVYSAAQMRTALAATNTSGGAE